MCRSTGSRSPLLTRDGICVPPTVTYLPYRDSGSTLTAVGRSQLLARWPGTHSRILFRIQRAAQTVLGVYLKRTCSRVTSTSSALGVLNDYALYKSTHSLTHSCRVFPKDYPLPTGLSLLLLQKLAFLPVRPMQVRVLAMTQCLCLSVSVISRCSVETAEQIELVLAWELLMLRCVVTKFWYFQK